MTIISPYQRQLVFTRSFSGSARSVRAKRGFLKAFRAIWKDGVENRPLPVHGVCAVCGVISLAILVFGIQAVLISFQKDALVAGLKQARVQREELEIRSAELLSPEALRIYADMVQLYQPTSIRYLSAEVPAVAHNVSVREVTP